MVLKLTSSRLKPIKKRGDKRYISASTLLKRHEHRPEPSAIPVLASLQLNQLVREMNLTDVGIKTSVLNNRGRSLTDFADSALMCMQSFQLLIQRLNQSPLDDKLKALLPKKSDRLMFNREQAADLAAALASIVHVRLWDAYNDGLNEGPQAARQGWRNDWQTQRSQYQSALSRLQDAARTRDSSSAANCVAILSEWALVELPAACFEAGRASAYARRKHHTSSSHFALMMSHLARRVAMLAGAAILLTQRLVDTRLRESTRKVAERRSTLMREEVDLWRTDFIIDDTHVGQTVQLTGRLDEVTWEERPGKSVSITRMSHLPHDILMPYKSLRRQGVAPSSYVWCQGRVKSASGQIYIEIDQEGPTEYAGDVWEDWLAVEMRPYYDLYPGSVEMIWEFPGEGHFGSKLDFLTRISR